MAPNVSKNSLLSRSNTRISLLPTANNRPSGENESVHAPAGSGNSAAIDDVSKLQMQTTRSYPATAKPFHPARMHRGCGLAQRHKAAKNIAVRLPVGQIQQYAAPAPRGKRRDDAMCLVADPAGASSLRFLIRPAGLTLVPIFLRPLSTKNSPARRGSSEIVLFVTVAHNCLTDTRPLATKRLAQKTAKFCRLRGRFSFEPRPCC